MDRFIEGKVIDGLQVEFDLKSNMDRFIDRLW